MSTSEVETEKFFTLIWLSVSCPQILRLTLSLEISDRLNLRTSVNACKSSLLINEGCALVYNINR